MSFEDGFLVAEIDQRALKFSASIHASGLWETGGGA
jgi:hypothetical protein